MNSENEGLCKRQGLTLVLNFMSTLCVFMLTTKGAKYLKA